MVGHSPLEASILVRIQVPQQKWYICDMEIEVDRSIELAPLRSNKRDVLQEVIDRFNYWVKRYKKSGTAGNSIKIEALGQALHESYFPEKLSSEELRSIVKHFSSRYSKDFAIWAKETRESTEDNINIVRIIALAGKKLHPKRKGLAHTI